MEIQLLRDVLGHGLLVPACPLPLDEQRRWSEQHQTALTRYYVDAGAGGLAVGVHSTQFAIRDPKFNLFRPVLQRVSQEIDAMIPHAQRQVVKIAGICGDTRQAIGEAELAVDFGYHAGLVSMTAFNNESEDALIEHCRRVSQLIPVFGFYLQPAVGGRVLSYRFWRKFCELDNVVAVKIAPFNRYQTWDVVRAVIESGRDDVALYTGNDDNIIVDLLTPFSVTVDGQTKTRFIDGGLLGQWGVWTRSAVDMLDEIKQARKKADVNLAWLRRNVALTDANAAIFDAAHSFAGCIAGILEVLSRQGLVPTCHCLDPNEVLSPGQASELDRVTVSYPDLADDEFVQANLQRWLA